jgi:GNAT superfamily N-acetyltransferase
MSSGAEETRVELRVQLVSQRQVTANAGRDRETALSRTGKTIMTASTRWMIRPALLTDSQDIAELHAASWRSAYKTALSERYLAGDIVADRNVLWKTRLSTPRTNQYVVVAENNREVVGFACVFIDDCQDWASLLDNIHIRQDQQRTGLGTALLQAVAVQCHLVAREAGLFLWVLQDNVNAQRFYARHGASNAGSDIWDAPGGTRVPRFRFAWSAAQLSALAFPDCRGGPRGSQSPEHRRISVAKRKNLPRK